MIQAKEESEMRHVLFDHLNTLNYKGWVLTGAVTFYESDVRMRNCVFQNNHCEDGLNIVRSKFDLESCTVQHAPFDAFDADFCSGVVRNSQFIDSGNDGLDFFWFISRYYRLCIER